MIYAEMYRAAADQVRLHAKHVAHYQSRLTLLDIAQRYEELADALENIFERITRLEELTEHVLADDRAEPERHRA